MKTPTPDQILRVIPPIFAIASTLVCVSLLMLLFGYPPLLVLATLATGAFGDAYTISEAVLKSIPLLFTGLAVAFAFQAGLWNIGADGQFISGAIAVTAVGVFMPSAGILLALAAALLAGGLCAGVAAVLREWRGVSEIITTIMLNVIALHLLGYLLHGPLQEAAGTYPQSDRLATTLRFDLLLSGTRLHTGLLLGLGAVAAAWLFFYRTPWGFQLRVIGKNPEAARIARIPLSRHLIFAMIGSGMLAALGGAVEVMGVTGRLYENISPGYGFTAIAVALLARLHPVGVVPAAFLFGALETGAKALQRNVGVSPVLAEVVQAMVIIFVVLYSTPWFASVVRRKFPKFTARATWT